MTQMLEGKILKSNVETLCSAAASGSFAFADRIVSAPEFSAE